MAAKLDLGKQLRLQYTAQAEPGLLEVPRAAYLTFEGQGEPGGEAFMAGMGALYAMTYTIKFAKKKAGRDYPVCAPEAQYWGPRAGECFARLPKSEWRWKLLLRAPSFLTAKDLAETAETLVRKGKPDLVRKVKLEDLDEGVCVQMLHVGPYDQVGETVGKLRAFAAAKGMAFHGRYHEIYLSDPRRVAPAKLKTIVRQPVK